MHVQPVPNRVQLQKLLRTADPKHETIYGIIGKMEVLLDFFEKTPQYHGLIPFLMTYYLVTKTSAERYIRYKHYFWNLRDHEILDVYFASLYFKPLFTFLDTGVCLPPWKHYFEYCRKPGGIPILQILLGINAHINTDLYSSIVHLQYKHQRDYFLVNDILQEVTPQVMQFLAFEKKDLFGFTGLAMRDFIINEFHLVIERWRSEAWMNAAYTTPKNKQHMYGDIVCRTEVIAEHLIRNVSDAYHLKNLSSVLAKLNALSIEKALCDIKAD